MNAVFRANAARAAARTLLGTRGRARIPALAGLLTLLVFAALEVVGLEAAIRASSAALATLPELRPAFLVERLLTGALGAAAALVLLGSLTTAVSTLFLSDELPALAVLPIPHRRLLARQAASTLALASAPSLLLALPALAVAAAASRAPALATSTGLLAVVGLFLLAGSAGIAGALVLVRLVPPRRARLFSALLSALGLSAALVGFRASRPERLLDPVEALGLLQSLGAIPPPAPGANPVGWAAHAAALGLAGDPAGLLPGAAVLALGLAAAALVPAVLAPVHLTVWRDVREASTGRGRPARRRPARSLRGLLLRAEVATVLRDASTPAQLGSLAAVFVLDLLNVRLLPSTDPAARDLVAGLQTGLALFLVVGPVPAFRVSGRLDGRALRRGPALAPPRPGPPPRGPVGGARDPGGPRVAPPDGREPRRRCAPRRRRRPPPSRSRWPEGSRSPRSTPASAGSFRATTGRTRSPSRSGPAASSRSSSPRASPSSRRSRCRASSARCSARSLHMRIDRRAAPSRDFSARPRQRPRFRWLLRRVRSDGETSRRVTSEEILLRRVNERCARTHGSGAPARSGTL